jgi:Uma2 family endonuclease
MAVTVEPSPAPLPDRLYRLTVGQYRVMVNVGVLHEDDPVELVDGLLIDKGRRSPRHTLVTHVLLRDFARRPLAGFHPAKGDPVEIPPDSVPEPDFAIVRGDPHDYATHHPGPADVPLVVEVADSSLAFDRGTKLRLYARAGLATYWIVNLVEGVVEVHTNPTGPAEPEPTYRRREVVGRDGTLTLDLGGAGPVRLAASDILPRIPTGQD